MRLALFLLFKCAMLRCVVLRVQAGIGITPSRAIHVVQRHTAELCKIPYMHEMNVRVSKLFEDEYIAQIWVDCNSFQYHAHASGPTLKDACEPCVEKVENLCLS